jgi:hypothetical protein
MAELLTGYCSNLVLDQSKNFGGHVINKRGDLLGTVYLYKYQYPNKTLLDVYAAQFIWTCEGQASEDIILIGIKEKQVVYFKRSQVTELPSLIHNLYADSALFESKFPYGSAGPYNSVGSVLIKTNTIQPLMRKYYAIHLMNQIHEWFPTLRGYGADLLCYRMRSLPVQQ